jgi:hypothetical protein
MAAAVAEVLLDATLVARCARLRWLRMSFVGFAVIRARVRVPAFAVASLHSGFRAERLHFDFRLRVRYFVQSVVCWPVFAEWHRVIDPGQLLVCFLLTVCSFRTVRILCTLGLLLASRFCCLPVVRGIPCLTRLTGTNAVGSSDWVSESLISTNRPISWPLMVICNKIRAPVVT